jgi:hypothetical protein
MDFTALQNQVRVLLGETTADFWTDQEVKDQINRCMPDICMEFEELVTFCEYTTAQSTYRYSLPANFLNVKHVELERTTDLIDKLFPVDIEQYWALRHGAATTESVPQYYKIELGAVLTTDDPQLPGDIWLYPRPDDNGGSNYTLRMFYYQDGSTTDLSTGTDIPLLSRYLHRAICYEAAKVLLYKADKLQKALIMGQEYEKQIVKANDFRQRMRRDIPPVVKDVMGYGIIED